MADYRLSADIIRRSKGRSVVAAAAYRAGEKLIDERTGRIHDSTRRNWSVLYTEILTPENAPRWMQDRQRLWNEVERREDQSTRRNQAQLARDIELSLPCELTHEQRLELVREFVKAEFVDQGMVADLAIHAPPKRGDGRNHHAHVLLTMREIEGDGFGAKNRHWNKDDQLCKWRERWEEYQNRALEKYGIEGRVDHRSLADQGIAREPTTHLGPATQAMEDKGIATDRGDENRRRQGANDNLELLRAELSEVEGRLAKMERAKRIIEHVNRVYQQTEDRNRSRVNPELNILAPSAYAGLREAAPMPDSVSSADKASIAAEAKEQQRQDQARKDQEAKQQKSVAESKRLDQLGQQHRDKVFVDAQVIQQQQDRLKADREAQQRHARWLEAQEKTARAGGLTEQRPKEQPDRKTEGFFRDPAARYANVLEYDPRNPYQSLAKAAMAEHAAFKSEQEALSRQIAGATDPRQRQALELRKKIEGYDYLIITGERIADQSLVITGRADNRDRLRTLENVAKYRNEAKALREQYRDLQAERTAPQQTLEKALAPSREGRQRERQPSKYARMVEEINDPEKARERQQQQERERQNQKDRDRER